jgi:heptosyltransferase III
MKKCAVFSCCGLGDGIVIMTLSHNLLINGNSVDTYHNKLGSLSSWFSNLPIKKYPLIEDIDQIINKYDQLFISYDASSEFVMTLIDKGKKIFPEKIFVLNPCPSKKIGGQPYYKDALFTPKLSFVDNLCDFCKDILHLPKIQKENGIVNPYDLINRKYRKKIAIHPTSGKEGKNWPIESYVKLALHLKEKGHDPIFVMSNEEKENFIKLEDIDVVGFDNYNDLAKYIYECGYFIGNDSGIGHLASSLLIPTVSIFRNHRTAKLWRPGFFNGIVLYPYSIIPNISPFRYRDKNWKKLISKARVYRAFKQLQKY